MSQDKVFVKQMEQLKDQTQSLSKSAGSALNSAYAAMKNMLSEDEYLKWKDISDRMLKARLTGDMKKVKSLEEDLKEIFEKTPE